MRAYTLINLTKFKRGNISKQKLREHSTQILLSGLLVYIFDHPIHSKMNTILKMILFCLENEKIF